MNVGFLWAIVILTINGTYVFAQGALQVEVTGIKETVGVIQVALFNKHEDYLKKPAHAQKVKASKGKVILNFDNLPIGDYAISLIHDENDNGVLDRNIIGIPQEGFGFGNDSMGRIGPPSFTAASVRHNGHGSYTRIKVRYY